MREISILVIVLEDTSQCNESVFFKFTRISRKKEYIYYRYDQYRIFNTNLQCNKSISSSPECHRKKHTVRYFSKINFFSLSSLNFQYIEL